MLTEIIVSYQSFVSNDQNCHVQSLSEALVKEKAKSLVHRNSRLNVSVFRPVGISSPAKRRIHHPIPYSKTLSKILSKTIATVLVCFQAL